MGNSCVNTSLARSVVVALLAIASFSNLHAQPAPGKIPLHFRHLSINLNNTRIETLLQDSYGFMWIGTLGGIHKYDGVNASVYLSSDDSTTISGNRASAFFEDSKGRFWIGTERGISLYNRSVDRFIRMKTNNGFVDPADPTLNRIKSIVEDEAGTIWMGSERGGLFYLNEERNSFEPYFVQHTESRILNNVKVVSLFAARDGVLWVGTTDAGIFKLHTQDGSIKQYQHDPKNVNSLAGNYAEDLLIDKKGRLWIATHENGLDRLDIQKNATTFIHYTSKNNDPYSLTNDDATTLFEDRSGKLWICNENGGFNQYNEAADNFYRYLPDASDPFSLANISVKVLYEDQEGRFWIGSNLEGIDIADRYLFKFEHYYQSKDFKSINNNIIRCMLEDKFGNLWIATDGGGLNYFDRPKNEFHAYRHDAHDPSTLSSDAALALCEDREGNLWIGTWRGGLNIFDARKQSFKQVEPDNHAIRKIFYLLRDREDNIWIATQSEGVSKYIWKENKIISYKNNPHDPTSLGDNDILVVTEDSKGQIWIGTEFNGLNLVVADENRNVTFSRFVHNTLDSNSISSDNVNHIFEDHHGTLWIATEGGLSKLTPGTKIFKNYTVRNGLESDHVKSITEDDHGFLWIGTSKGISKFDPVKETFRNYTSNDGLQTGGFTRYSVYKTRKGELVFGGSNGFNIFHPDSLRDNPFPPRVYLTGFKIFNQPVLIGEEGSPLSKHISETTEVTLSYQESVFSFDFVGINYTNPDQNQYAYKMENFEERWNYVGNQRTATYTSLDPGEYVFRVIAANNDGVWNTNGASIRIIITPPFWQTNMFKVLVGLACAGLIYFVIRYRLRHLSRINLSLEEKVNERTMQLENLVDELKDKQTEVETANRELTITKKQLESVNDELDKRVHDRTSELVKTNQQLDRFVYSASHDLSAPLKSMLGLINIARTENGDKIIDQYLDHMERSVVKLEIVIRHLIQFSRNMSAVTKAPIVFDNLVDEVLDDLKYFAHASNINLIKEYAKESILYSDHPRVKIILTNLITNAIKYRDLNKLQRNITIRFENGRSSYKIEVEDNGIGIEKEYQSKIFDMFFRATTTSQGSGLGLYIVKDIVEKLEGEVRLECEPGIYTLIRISIPQD